MPDSIMRHRALRLGLLGVCCALAIGGVACFTPEASRKHAAATRNPVDYIEPLQDTLLGSARLSPGVEQKIGCTNGVAFLGTNHTYIVTEGGERLIALSQEIGTDRLQLVCQPGLLLYYKQRFWGTARLQCDLTAEETAGEFGRKLQQLGFTKDSRSAFVYALPVAGTIQDPLKLSQEQMNRFAQPRKVQFHKPVRNYHVGENLSYTFVKLPLAIVADTALVAGAIVALPIVGTLILLDP